jgi:hypothetical protein
MLRAIGLALCLAIPAAARAQEPGAIEALLAETLLNQGGEIAAWYFLPDAEDPAAASEALGVIYEEIRGAAGNSMIAVGHFVREGESFALAGRVAEVFGQEPRDAAFLADRIEVTTTMPKPDDPRCCPTGASRWIIDRATLTAVEQQLN